MSAGEIPFIKLEGCGNNFVVTHDIGNPRSDWQEISPLIQDPNFGVAADGLMVVTAQRGAESFNVSMFNPDGSPMGMCGNGIRCVARYLVLAGLLPQEVREAYFNVDGRAISCVLRNEGRMVTVNMGEPTLDPAQIPLLRENSLIDEEIDSPVGPIRATAVSMGNPHLVLFTPDLAKVDLYGAGAKLEHHPLFPKRTNVEFVQVLSPDRLKVLVWERGAGPTLACGTGACAAVVAGVVTEKCARKATVELPGGELEIEFTGAEAVLTGPAREVFSGVLFERVLTDRAKERRDA